jgi:transposase
MQIAVLGIDLGKNSCSIVGLDDGGAVVLRRRMRREGDIKLAVKLKPCVLASFSLRSTAGSPKDSTRAP